MDRDKTRETRQEIEEANRKISRPGERRPQEAAAAVLNPAALNTNPSILIDGDEALDQDSETEENLEEATGDRDGAKKQDE